MTFLHRVLSALTSVMLRTFHLQFCSLPFTSSSVTFWVVILNVFFRASVAMFFHYCCHNVFLMVLHLQTLILLLLCILLGIMTSMLCLLHLPTINFMSQTPAEQLFPLPFNIQRIFLSCCFLEQHSALEMTSALRSLSFCLFYKFFIIGTF